MSPAASDKGVRPAPPAPAPSGRPGGDPDLPVKIAVHDLDFYYGDFQALKKVTLDIRDRTITALIGPSGCGKTTFLRAINRMNDSIRGARAAGQILIDGRDIYEAGTDVVELRRRVGMVFQRPNPFPQSVFDNVAFGPIVLGLANGKGDLAARVEKSLREVGLWDEVKDALEAPAQALNPGQQQRLCIARTVATSPEIILMDEPCSALDPVATLRIETLMRQLAREYTIVVVTHNMQQAARVSQWTGFFWLGELVEFNSTAQLFTRPQASLTEDYITGRRG